MQRVCRIGIRSPHKNAFMQESKPYKIRTRYKWSMAEVPALSQGEEEIRTVTFRVTAEVVLSEIIAPVVVRYTFLNGDRVESPPLSLETESEQPSEWLRKHAETPASNLDPDQPPWIFTHDHELCADNEMLMKINENPIVCFFVATRPSGEEEARNYVCTLHCDLSAFLGNKECVVAVRDSRNRAPKFKGGKKDNAIACETSPFSPAAPLYDDTIRFVRITIAFAPNSPLLMSDEALKRHNPLTITLPKVQFLPGARTTSASLVKYVEPCPHLLLRQCCRSLYCIVRPPLASIAADSPDLASLNPQIRNSLRRGSATDCRSSAANVSFDHSVVYLTGHLERAIVEEIFATVPVAVEVHDRDLLLDIDDEAEQQIRTRSLLACPDLALELWERIAKAEVSFQLVSNCIDGRQDATCEATKDNCALETETIPAEEQRPPDIFEVDKLFTKAIVASWTRAGDDNTHGRAEVRVDKLLDSAPAVAGAFREQHDRASVFAAPLATNDVPEVKEASDEAYTEDANTAQRSVTQRLPNALITGESRIDDEALSLDGVSLTKNSKFPMVKCKADVTPRKQRVIPKGGIDKWRLNEGERIVALPGAYSDSGTVVTFLASLFMPLRTLAEGAFYDGIFWEKSLGNQPFLLKGGNDSSSTPEVSRLAPSSSARFSRAALVFPYSDTTLLQKLTGAIDNTNANALGPSITGSLKSYQLSNEQVARAHDGLLDIICGFHIIDQNSRTIVFEGIFSTVENVLKAIEIDYANEAYRLLVDSTCRFSTRLYTPFHTDLKKVRLRVPLPILIQSPEIYNRTKVSVETFDALYRLMNIRRSPGLKELCLHDEACGLPEVHMILQIESKFGEPITTTDIDGRPEQFDKSKDDILDIDVTDETTASPSSSSNASQSTHEREGEESQPLPKEKMVPRRKAPTDTSNSEYESFLRTRDVVDYVELRKRESQEAAKVYVEWRNERNLDHAKDEVRSDFIYSIQKLQYTELKKAEQRSRLRAEKNATFVRSDRSDFLNLTVPLVDETRLKQDAAAESRSRWKTTKGFVYPAPKAVEDYNVHPRKLSGARVDELKEPWVEGSTMGSDLSRVDDASLAMDPNRKFDNIPSSDIYFGGFDRPSYQRDYERKDVGNPRRLPRGKEFSRKLDDTQYNRSVHLCGDGLAAEAAEAREKDLETFRSKLVVDTLDFKVGRYCQIDTPNQADRLKDILHNPPKALFLKKVRNAKLPSGKMSRLLPPPFSIFTNEEYTPAQEYFSEQLRNYAPDHKMKDDADGWTKAIHRDTLRRASERILCHKPITALDYSTETEDDRRWS